MIVLFLSDLRLMQTVVISFQGSRKNAKKHGLFFVRMFELLKFIKMEYQGEDVICP